MSERFLVIKTGRTYDEIRDAHGCFDDWMAAGLGVTTDDIAVVRVFEGEPLPQRAQDYAGIVITGSPAMVSDREAWSEMTARWLADVLHKEPQVPVIGICYGHQLLAHALGGRVDYNPRGREIGTVTLQLTDEHADDPLFGGMDPQFDAHVTHLQSAIALPPGAVHLAASDLEPHHAFRVGDRAWGVQFHPEFTDAIMRAYVDRLGERMAGEGLAVDTIRAAIRAAPASNAVLRRFAGFARGIRSRT